MTLATEGVGFVGTMPTCGEPVIKITGNLRRCKRSHNFRVNFQEMKEVFPGPGRLEKPGNIYPLSDKCPHEDPEPDELDIA